MRKNGQKMKLLPRVKFGSRDKTANCLTNAGGAARNPAGGGTGGCESAINGKVSERWGEHFWLPLFRVPHSALFAGRRFCFISVLFSLSKDTYFHSVLLVFGFLFILFDFYLPS